MSVQEQMRPGDGSSGRDSGPLVPNLGKFNFSARSHRHDTPWLVVRHAPGDAGSRPLPGGAVFWESPDVWVVSSAGVNQPVPGEENSVFARVTNLGLPTATGVQVKFWWANPSIAITESNAHLIGLGSANIPSGWSVVVKCGKPWVPIEVNNGHECLLAEAFIPNFDPLTAPLDPVDDRHVGQKNEQLVVGAPGQDFNIPLEAVNASAFAQTLTFEVRPIVTRTVSAMVSVRELVLPAPVRVADTPLPLSFGFREEPSSFVAPSALFARRLLSTTLREIAGAEVTCSAPAQITRNASFDPWERRNIEIGGRIPEDAESGQSFSFRVVQRAGRIVTGGYTVNAVVARPSLGS